MEESEVDYLGNTIENAQEATETLFKFINGQTMPIKINAIDNDELISKTSITARKRIKRNVNRTLNVTNLNILFDSSQIIQKNEKLNIPSHSKCFTSINSEAPNLKQISNLATSNDDLEFHSLTSINSQKSQENINASYKQNGDGNAEEKLVSIVVPRGKFNNYNLLNNSSTSNENITHIYSNTFSNMALRETSNSSLQTNEKETLGDKLKRVSICSTYWPYNIIGLCTYIAFILRKKFSTFCGFYAFNQSSLCVNSSSTQSNDIFRADIDHLNIKLDLLRNDLEVFKKQVCENYENKIKNLDDKLIGLREEFLDFKSIKSDIRAIKDFLANNQLPKLGLSVSGPLIGIPPTPPPPPPLPLIGTENPTNNSMKVAGCKKVNKKIEQRPLITLDDILKVKLKKPTERPYCKKINQQQVSSSNEVLRKMKLKGRPQREAENQKNPCPSLTQILSDNPVRNIKQVKIINHYSFNDIFREEDVIRERERAK